MDEIAGWVAPAATMVAACMTAANLGARFTGWGFVVFLVGSIAWTVVAFGTGQQNLLATNAFLTLVNAVGIWRWLGRRAKFDDAAHAEQTRSEHGRGADLFAVSKLDGMAVKGRDGAVLASVVDAMTACGDGRVDYLIVREGGVGGVGETLRRLDWDAANVCGGAVETKLDAAGLARLPELSPA